MRLQALFHLGDVFRWPFSDHFSVQYVRTKISRTDLREFLLERSSCMQSHPLVQRILSTGTAVSLVGSGYYFLEWFGVWSLIGQLSSTIHLQSQNLSLSKAKTHRLSRLVNDLITTNKAAVAVMAVFGLKWGLDSDLYLLLYLELSGVNQSPNCVGFFSRYVHGHTEDDGLVNL